MDDPDTPVPVGEVGQIGGRGASLMLGYFDDQRATEIAFNRNGWFMTGDLGRLDDAGYLQITGRLKDVIIRGGHNIHPARIEHLTMQYPGVERAAAIPVKDARLGEKVCIVVMAKDGAAVDPGDLLAHLNAEGLSKFDMPEYFLAVREIPLSANGKILKRALIPPVEDGKLKPVPVRWQGQAGKAE
jgi:acyl-CoA synthetase